MKWPWSRGGRDQPAPEPEKEPQGEQMPLQTDELDLEEQILATANVMAIRDAINVFLVIVRDHREDGHDCPPYCVPGRLAYFLQVMDDDDLRAMLIVLLKDTVDNYLRQAET